jgi:hypothetical protein
MTIIILLALSHSSPYDFDYSRRAPLCRSCAKSDPVFEIRVDYALSFGGIHSRNAMMIGHRWRVTVKISLRHADKNFPRAVSSSFLALAKAVCSHGPWERIESLWRMGARGWMAEFEDDGSGIL